MSKIAVLSKEISELIAAGEVIERPASVVKEVVENAIDAEAKHITVEIKHGGTTYMGGGDEGSGSASVDVPTAFSAMQPVRFTNAKIWNPSTRWDSEGKRWHPLQRFQK